MNGPEIHSRDLRRRAKLTRFAFLLATALLSAACNRQEDGKQPSAPPVQPPQTAPSVPAPATDQPGAQRQTPAPAVASKPLTDLESLVAPIALYPDPLLAELLVASTYPLEVVEAARWLDSKPDPATLKTKGWDASVMRLTEVPSVIKMMNDHLEWTTQLGDAFLAKPDELMDAIQRLRKRATDSGFLKDSPEQKVTAKTVSETQPAEPTPAPETPSTETGTVKATPAVAKKEVISIEPAKSDTVYVPQYNPEQAYSASLAPPPISTAGYSYPTTSPGYPAAAPASYYPTYYPAPATTSSTDQWLSFGTGAVVGGLLTWGIMEWIDDDDWDDDYHVAHYYGDAVCHEGNCWHGGGGYYGSRGDISVDRGDITRNRNVNISGNEITVNREGTFSQNQLASLRQQPTAWTHDTRHRRGQRYPEAAQQRLGQVRQAALAGHRFGAAQTLPEEARGFAPAGAKTPPAERRPSSAEVRERLAQKPGAQEKPGARPAQPRPSTREVQGRLEQGRRDNALEGLRASGQEVGIESRRGAESRRKAPPETREIRPREQTVQPRREVAAGQRPDRQRIEQPQTQERAQRAEKRTEMPQRAERVQQPVGGRDRAQQADRQRRSESARPNAFEGAGDARRTQNFSQRGAASRERMAAGGGRHDFGSGAKRGVGGGRRR